MNSIKAKIQKSEYEIYDDYMNFKIDKNWLDEFLEDLYPGNFYKGLVPTLLFWMEIEAERKLVWQRILPKENQKSICPILMCPDECDFSCTLIIAEIENFGNSISWNRIGINQTINSETEKIGSDVIWFDKIGQLKFEIREYIEMINVFEKQFEIDKLSWEKLNEELSQDIKK